MRIAYKASLLEDPFFLAELEKVEIGTVSEERFAYGGASTFDEGTANDDGMAMDAYAARWRYEHPVWPDDEPQVRSHPPSLILRIGAFLFLMLVGAAAAVFVFQDRVIQILR